MSPPKTFERRDTRTERREKVRMNNYLRELVQRFFLYRNKLKDPDGKLSVAKLSEINLEWIKYCNRKRKSGISPKLNIFVDVVMDYVDKANKKKKEEALKKDVIEPKKKLVKNV